MLDELEAVHSTEHAARRLTSAADRGVFGKGARFIHPAVVTDPVSGRRILYVNSHYTERLSGVTAAESASILEFLFGHIATPEFHVRWQWQLNDIVIWDERLTQHRAVADYEGTRAFRRAAIKGDRPR